MTVWRAINRVTSATASGRRPAPGARKVGLAIAPRSATGALGHARGALDCVGVHGFHDGVSSLAYALQRVLGDGYQDRAPWLRYIRVYPFHTLFTQFDGVVLDARAPAPDRQPPPRQYEDCFALTLPGVVPVLLLGGFALTLQFYALYALWGFSVAALVLLRDVRNSAILLGIRNDLIRARYVERDT